MKRLLAYGYTPTGDKDTDKATLRRIELKKATEDTCASDKYLTVSYAECVKIQEKKKAQKKQNDVSAVANINANIKGKKPDRQIGAELLGQQIYIAIQMKSDAKKKWKHTKLDKVA